MSEFNVAPVPVSFHMDADAVPWTHQKLRLGLFGVVMLLLGAVTITAASLFSTSGDVGLFVLALLSLALMCVGFYWFLRAGGMD